MSPLVYRLVIGTEPCVTFASKEILMQSKRFATYVQHQDPRGTGGNLVLFDEDPAQAIEVLKYLNNGKMPNPLIGTHGVTDTSGFSLITGDDDDDDIRGDIVRYIIAMHYGVDTLCAEIVARVRHRMHAPWGINMHVPWEDIILLMKAKLGDSPLAETMIRGKVWMMRFFGEKDMPRYKAQLINHPELMFKCLTYLSSSDAKTCPSGEWRECMWHIHGDDGEIIEGEEELHEG